MNPNASIVYVGKLSRKHYVRLLEKSTPRVQTSLSAPDDHRSRVLSLDMPLPQRGRVRGSLQGTRRVFELVDALMQATVVPKTVVDRLAQVFGARSERPDDAQIIRVLLFAATIETLRTVRTAAVAVAVMARAEAAARSHPKRVCERRAEILTKKA